MKKLCYLCLLLVLTCPGNMFADDIPIIPVENPGGPVTPLRPHDEVNMVSAYYDNCTLYISFESYEGMATATLTNLFSGESDSWTFSTATQPSSHYIGSAPGTYSISITTREASYNGVFAIE